MRQTEPNDVPNRIPDTSSASLAVVRGSLPRSLARVESRKLIHREGHALVLHATQGGMTRAERSANPERFSWLGDLRRGRRHIWGGILSFVDELVARGHPETVVQMIPSLLREYVADQFRGRAA